MKSLTHAARTTVCIMLISFFSKFLGLLRESALAAKYGVSYKTDAYKFALDIMIILFSIFSSSLVTVFIPAYINKMKERSGEKKDYFVNNVLCIVISICLIVIVLAFFSAPVLIRILAPGFSGEVYSLTLRLTRIIIPALLFLVVSGLQTAYLQANDSFIVPAMTEVIYNVLIISSILFLTGFGVETVAIGSSVAIISLVVFQLRAVFKTGYRFHFVFDPADEEITSMRKLIGPVIVGSSFNQVYIIIDRMLASGLAEGSISALDFANKINGLVYNAIILSIITVIYPRLSAAAADAERFYDTVRNALKIIIYISLPMMVGLYILKVPVTGLLFQRGAFTNRDTYITSAVLGAFCLGIVGMGLREMLNRVFYSMEDTVTPMRNGMVAIALNIVINLILVRPMGIVGLALGSAISANLCTVMILVKLNKKLKGGLRLSEVGTTLLKGFIAAFIMGVGVFILWKWNGADLFDRLTVYERVFRLFTLILSGAVIYAGMLYVMKEEMVREVCKSFRAKFQKSFSAHTM